MFSRILQVAPVCTTSVVFARWRQCADDTFHELCNKSSAVAEMDDRKHNRHEPISGGFCASFRGSWVPM